MTRTEGPRLTSYVGPELRERAERYAKSQGLSVSTLILLALRRYLDENEPPESRKRRSQTGRKKP